MEAARQPKPLLSDKRDPMLVGIPPYFLLLFKVNEAVVVVSCLSNIKLYFHVVSRIRRHLEACFCFQHVMTLTVTEAIQLDAS